MVRHSDRMRNALNRWSTWLATGSVLELLAILPYAGRTIEIHYSGSVLMWTVILQAFVGACFFRAGVLFAERERPAQSPTDAS